VKTSSGLILSAVSSPTPFTEYCHIQTCKILTIPNFAQMPDKTMFAIEMTFQNHFFP